MKNINYIHGEDDEVQQKFGHDSTKVMIDDSKIQNRGLHTIQALSSQLTTPFQIIITITKIIVSHISSRSLPLSLIIEDRAFNVESSTLLIA